VVVWHQDQNREIILLTNHLDFGPTTISAIYKYRWQIELFFKALEQNLKVKTFVGTTENTLFIQTWTAVKINRRSSKRWKMGRSWICLNPWISSRCR
jgi:IS4 transposase